MTKPVRLKKELRFFEVYAVATGTTLSAGFFLLPGLAAGEAGSSIVLAYLLASLPLIPAMLCTVELATAMPRAGGVYYVVDRALGPYFGLLTGFGTWLAMILKVTFALVGMGAYIGLFFPGLPQVPVALALVVLLGLVNYVGTSSSGRLQIYLVLGLLALLAGFIFTGLPEIQSVHFDGVFDTGASTLISTAGMVYISYVGVTKVASLSEEVENPEKNLPRGVFLALATAMLIYGLGIFVMVGVIPPDSLVGDLTPAATAAELLLGGWGGVLISVAAILAFVSVANAGILSASRYPLAMSRDLLIPPGIARLSANGVPKYALLITLGTIVLVLLLMNPAGIAKLASAFQLLVFAFVCFAVIVMRESRINSYDPGYRSPWYPWLQLSGMVMPLVVIWQMDWLVIPFTAGLIIVATLWYVYYARFRADRNGAVYHIFERLGQSRHRGLDHELRGILKEKGLRDNDPFEEVIVRSQVIELEEETGFDHLSRLAAKRLAPRVDLPEEHIVDKLLGGSRMGVTPVAGSVALPHFRVPNLVRPELVLVRCMKGVHVAYRNPVSDQQEEMVVHAVLFLASPAENPAVHLRILARVAERADEEHFDLMWDAALDEQALRGIFLRHDRYLIVAVLQDTPAAVMIGRRISDLGLPDGCHILWIRHLEEVVIPQGDTVVQRGDLLTVVGEPKELAAFRKVYGDHGT